jgi:transposase
MSRHKSFTKEFETEALHLAQTSGRTQCEIAPDLGVGRSTLVRWIGRSRDQAMDKPSEAAASEDMVAELKRLRRETKSLGRTVRD